MKTHLLQERNEKLLGELNIRLALAHGDCTPEGRAEMADIRAQMLRLDLVVWHGSTPHLVVR